MIGATAFAQSANLGTIQGRVQNATNGLYLKNARITVEGTTLETLTDEYGDYSLTEVPAGADTLKVFYTGLEQQTVTVNVPAGQTVQQNFLLASARFTQEVKDNVVKLDQFVVTAARETNASAIAVSEQRFAPNIKNVVASDAFGNVVMGNVGEFVKFLPGITVDYTAADVRTISVRGLGANFTTVSVDGTRVAGADSGVAGRVIELEQLSINNAARIEVVKEPTPDMPADMLGGAINLVSRNAFEQAKTVFNYQAYVSMNEEDQSLIRKTPGPGVNSTYKVLPGGQFNYIAPLAKNFGIAINALSSNQFNEQHRSQPTWQFTTAGASTSTPQLNAYTMQDGPKVTYRDSISLKADWKLTPNSVLSGTYQYNYYKNFFGNRNMNFSTGTTSVPTPGTGTAETFGPTFTYGATGRGSDTQSCSFRDKLGATNIALLTYNYTGRIWKLSAGASWSQSRGDYQDLANGHWNAVTTQLQGASRVLFDGITYPRPDVITVLTTAGAPIDYTNLSNYRLTTMRTSPLHAVDVVDGYNVNLERDLDFLPFPASLKIGGDVRQDYRDFRRYQADTTFVGADGVANTADDAAAPYLDRKYIGMDPYWGFNPIQWADPFALGSLYQTNPNYFAQTLTQQTSALKYQIANSQKFNETISSAYLQAEAKLLHNRLRIITGVRLEQTDDKGVGPLYLRGASTSATVAQVLATRVERGYTASQTYRGSYPSFHATYNFTDNLLVRFAYAQTLGRPDLTNVIPTVRVNDTTSADNTDGLGTIPAQTVIVSNPNLSPWTGRNYDLSLEYYFKDGGLFTVGAFQKDLSNFFGTDTHIVTAADAATYQLDPSYVGVLTLQRTINVGTAHIKGGEFNFIHPLDFLPWWGKYFNFTANATILHLQGASNAQFANFIPKVGNMGLTFSKTPLVLRVKWNFRGQERIGTLTTPTNAYDWYSTRTYIDVDGEYQISPRFSVFVSGSNITNVPQNELRYSTAQPLYSQFYRAERYGSQWVIGVKGSF